MRPLADFHTHTRWSHGEGSVADNVRAAEAAGLETLGIAEHGPNLLLVGVKHSRWSALAQEIKAVAATTRVKLLFNVEANVISTAGDLDVPVAVASQLDMLLVGLHPRVLPRSLADAWAFYGRRWLGLFTVRQRQELLEIFTRALVNCVNSHRVDIVTHPGHGLPLDTRELARACARRGTRLEINCRHVERTAKDIAIAAQEPGLEFVIGSDAHSPHAVGDFRTGLNLVRKLNIDRERIVNIKWQE